MRFLGNIGQDEEEEAQNRRLREAHEERMCSCGPCRRRSFGRDGLPPVSDQYPSFFMVTPAEAEELKKDAHPTTSFEEQEEYGEKMVLVTFRRSPGCSKNTP